MMKYDTSRLTPRMVRALERADEFADSFGHDYTGAEHVVLSILADKEAAPTDIAEQLGALGALIYELHQYVQTSNCGPVATKFIAQPAEPTEAGTTT